MNDCVIIYGDFNHSSIDWNTLHAGSKSQEFSMRDFFPGDIVLDYFFMQHIREPAGGEDVLNLVFTLIECMIDNVKMCEPFSSSDHNFITFDLLYDCHMTIWREYCFDYRRLNNKEMDKSLQCVDWDALFSDNNVNEKLAIFKVVLDNAVSKFVPKRKRRSRQKQVWWT